jgi:general secretion pathway protein G
MVRRRGSQAGFSYIELLVTATVLVVLASVAVPMFKWDQKRRKEGHLRVQLQQMRDAIDQFKKYADEGRILLEDVDQMGYPMDLQTLVDGFTVSNPVVNTEGGDEGFQGESAEGRTIRFLREIPVDPITGIAEWGMRSYQDDWDSDNWGGENLYDVYSLSDKKALNGTYYKEW